MRERATVLKEHIYTIPLNENFSVNDGCPICRIQNILEKNEIETITGASMMEPSVRVQTNETGFCDRHFSQMLISGKKLPVTLILQSHLEEIRAKLKKKNGNAQIKYLEELEHDCYVCRRLNNNMENLYSNLFWLYRNDENFKRMLEGQKMFCLPHYRLLLKYGAECLPKKEFNVFADKLSAIEEGYLNTLQEDVDWFCKKFDYRFRDEDWKNSKDAPERTVYTLTGKVPAGRENK